MIVCDVMIILSLSSYCHYIFNYMNHSINSNSKCTYEKEQYYQLDCREEVKFCLLWMCSVRLHKIPRGNIERIILPDQQQQQKNLPISKIKNKFALARMKEYKLRALVYMSG